MARREVSMNEMVEMIYQWHQGAGLKRIKQSLGFDRKTIRKYIQLAQKVGVRRVTLFPEEGELIHRLKGLGGDGLLRETPAQELLAPHREWFKELLAEKEMTAKQVWRLFKEKTGTSVGYCTVKRYLRTQLGYRMPRTTVRIEVEPGTQAQVDFGYVGLMRDPETGKNRKVWAFVMILAYSRHRFVRLVFRQDIPTWIDCHLRAFEFFQGVPASVVLDNLKAGVLRPDIYDPTLNRAYGELERHYGFVADPAKVREPGHKGKTERAIPGVRKHLLAGRNFKDLPEANQRALHWCKEEVGMELHGTTKRRPYEVFRAEEAPLLKPLPGTRFESPLWKSCKVHPDHHIVFDRSYYSLPTRYIGKEVWVRGTDQMVQIFLNEALIKIHIRAQKPGTWVTDLQDYPPAGLAYLMATPNYCRKKAREVGPQTEAFISEILSEHAMRHLRKAQAVLRLAQKYGAANLEAAAGRALAFGNFRYKSLEAVLKHGWATPPESTEATPFPLSLLGQSFLRDPRYFIPPKEVVS